jgi:hypothetical protein
MDPCAHDWIEITTATEAAEGLRRFICVLAGCDAEKTEPTTQ